MTVMSDVALQALGAHHDLVKRVNQSAINAAGQQGILSGLDPSEYNANNVSFVSGHQDVVASPAR